MNTPNKLFRSLVATGASSTGGAVIAALIGLSGCGGSAATSGPNANAAGDASMDVANGDHASADGSDLTDAHDDSNRADAGDEGDATRDAGNEDAGHEGDANGDAGKEGDAPDDASDSASCGSLFQSCTGDSTCCAPYRCLNITGTLECQSEGPAPGGDAASLSDGSTCPVTCSAGQVVVSWDMSVPGFPGPSGCACKANPCADGGTDCTCQTACESAVPGSGACCGWLSGVLTCDQCG